MTKIEKRRLAKNERQPENTAFLQDTLAIQKGHPSRCPFCVSNLKF